VSSHRAAKPDSRRAEAAARATHRGRRRARAPRRSHSGLSLSTTIGTAALLIAAAGAATAGQTISTAGDSGAASARTAGGYVANLSSASLEGRDATQISRSGARPTLTQALSDQARAEKAAAARNNRLSKMAATAEKYAKKLSSNVWVMPTSNFHISVWFGEAGWYWETGFHTGIDFATAYGTPVVAVGNATVAQTGWDGPYGNQIRMTLENGDQVWYNHLSSIEVSVGDTVLKGQEIGRVGDTGNAYGYHLHFEYRLASDLDTPVDPEPYFAEHGIPLR
jgi:murein DD-endopeptidase MepM/ murein hydrolase activator NlpD